MSVAFGTTRRLIVVLATVFLQAADGRSTAEGFASRIRRERSAGDDARVIESIELDLVVDNQRIELRMEKNPNIRNNLPYYISSGGVITGWRPAEDETLSAYYDKETGDHLVVNRKSKNGTRTVEHMGSFARDGFTYSLMSLDTNLALRGSIHGRTDISDLRMVQIDGEAHVVEKFTRARTNFENDEEISRLSHDNDFINHQIRQGKRSYVVDYFAILDYSIYNRWFSASRASSDAEKKQDAIKQIRYYYSYVLNGVDARYASIMESDFSINVRFIGYLIAEKPEDSPWTESADLKITVANKPYSNLNKVNPALQKWIKDNPLVATADHVGLFSRNYLYDGTMNPDNTPHVISGMAPIGQVCSATERISTSYEFGQYSTIETAAHELAHNLGSYHDGQSNDCKSADQYIMAVSPGELTDENFRNPFRFSPCSIAAIRNKLVLLPDDNCLLVKSPQPDVAFDKSTLPGQAYAVDEQCKQLQDEKSFYCAGASSDDILCKRMVCWRDDLKSCNSPVEQRAYDGTSCGNNKWCQDGKCVSDNAAPAAKDKCLYGDFKDVVDIGDGVRLKCSEIAAQRPYMCYEERVFGQCCDTCAKIRKADKPGCEYGDKDPNYCNKGAISTCYDANFKAKCCAKCAIEVTPNVNGGAPACQYGDHADWCATVASYKCYSANTGTNCCKTCAKYYTGKKDCEYGDHRQASTCASVTKEQCAVNQNQNDWGIQCCASCAKLSRMDDLDRVLAAMSATGRATCADRAEYCSAVQAGLCYDKNVERTCCATCESHAREKSTGNGCRYGEEFVTCSGNTCTTTRLDCTDFAIRDLLRP